MLTHSERLSKLGPIIHCMCNYTSEHQWLVGGVWHFTFVYSGVDYRNNDDSNYRRISNISKSEGKAVLPFTTGAEIVVSKTDAA